MSRREDIRSRVLAQITRAAEPASAPSSADQADALAVREPTRVKAHIAMVGEQVREGFASRVERLEAERQAGMVVLRLDPKRIRSSEFANRLEAGLKDEDAEFRLLKEDIRTQGQLDPIRVRPAPAGSGVEYEIIYGHRRHAAALALDRETEGGFRVLALLDAASVDRKRLALQMHAENDVREDLSPYEYGRMYQSWLNAKLFDTQGELAAAVGRDDSPVSMYLQIAELPAEVVAAFADPREISLRWAPQLMRALKADREQVLATARGLAALQPRPGAAESLRALTAARMGKLDSASREEAVKIKGRIAFRVARRDGRLTLKFGSEIGRQVQKELVEEIKELTERRLAQYLKAKPQ
ncbi:MAG TPA: ParB/RepB/Spo0J family partition protein [Steroidobacteraceae bacterium]